MLEALNYVTGMAQPFGLLREITKTSPLGMGANTGGWGDASPQSESERGMPPPQKLQLFEAFF